MQSFRTRIFALLLSFSALSASSAGAAELGLYVGLLYGEQSKDYDYDQFDYLSEQIYSQLAYEPVSRAISTDEDGESYGFLVGYRLTQNIAIEGGYTYLGKQSFADNSSGFFVPGGEEPPVAEEWGLGFTSRSKGFMLSALGILPISYSWEVYARGGVFIASNQLSLYAGSPSFSRPLTDRYTESSTDWLAGAGIAMSLAEVYSLRAEFTRIFDAGEPVFGEANVDLISVSITVAF